MPRVNRTIVGLVTLAASLFSGSTLWAQDDARIELGAGYTYIRTNAPPGGCGCFSLNGGSGWLGYKLTPNLALIAEGGAVYASHIARSNAGETLSSFLGGPRFSHSHGRLSPFVQLLLGGSHSSGPLTPTAAGLSSSANAFAMAVGGGLDVALSKHISLRAVQADYFLTRFNNGSNDHQNNLRIGAGVVFRFHPR